MRLLGLHVDIEAGPPVFACGGSGFGTVGVVSPDVAVPQWWLWEPNGVSHASDSLQERRAGPLSGVFSVRGQGSEGDTLLIRCS